MSDERTETPNIVEPMDLNVIYNLLNQRLDQFEILLPQKIDQIVDQRLAINEEMLLNSQLLIP